MTPYLDDGDVTLYHGDALTVLQGLPDRSVHMCATSPPFYGLRDYGVDGQIGLEDTIEEWIERLCDVFDEVRRVLRDDATLWIEIGDSLDSKQLVGQPWRLAFALQARGWFLRSEIIWARLHPNPMPESVTDRPTKSHSAVFLLSKQPSYFFDADAIREPYIGLPEVRQGRVGAYQNRAMNGEGDGTTATRILASAPPQAETLDGSGGEAPRGPDGRRVTRVVGQDGSEQHRDGERWPNPSGANARSVWVIPTEPTPYAHFATWPRKLVTRMILAGTSERGVCPECGAPWVRIMDIESSWRSRAENGATRGNLAPEGLVGAGTQRAVHGGGVSHDLDSRRREFLGWRPSCDHRADPVPAVVLDPFAGSGTTLLVARNLGRHSIGIELNSNYLEIAANRLAQQSLLTQEPA